MGDGPDTLSHIDGTNYELWMPGALGIKGDSTKPQTLDTSKVIPTVDVVQGGFANETQQRVVNNVSNNIAGIPSTLHHPGVSCRFSAGGLPGSEPKNESPFHARVHRAHVKVNFTEAGIASMTNRYMVIAFGYTSDSGLQAYISSVTKFLYDKQADYHHYDRDIIVFPGYEFVIRVALQPPYAGAAPGNNFPAGTTASFTVISYKKPLGGQLPL